MQAIKGAYIPRWREVPMVVNINGQQVVEIALHSKDAGNEPGVESLAEYLDKTYYPGILQELAKRYLGTVRPFLEEQVTLDAEAQFALHDPKAYFETDDEEAAIKGLIGIFSSQLDSQSPEHCKRAMIAFIQYGLGKYTDSIQAAGFAHNEKAIPDFGKELADDTSLSLEIILKSERLAGDILVKLISEFKDKNKN